jgi:hypothetical protein
MDNDRSMTARSKALFLGSNMMNPASKSSPNEEPSIPAQMTDFLTQVSESSLPPLWKR